MDYQHRPGGKTGTGGVASYSDANVDRRERLRQLALDTIDLEKDPYFMKNHLGTYECKLCLTLHSNEGSYLAHTQGKKHQYNLQKRAAEQSKETPIQPAPEKFRVETKKFVKIGRPGYKVTKQRDPDTGQQSMLFQVDYPEISDTISAPRHRFMSAYEQRVEPPDRMWQYLLIAAEPYETIAFKVPSREVDKDPMKLWTHWNTDSKQFFLQFAFRHDPKSMVLLRELELQKARAQQAQMQLSLPPPPPPPPMPTLLPPSQQAPPPPPPAPVMGVGPGVPPPPPPPGATPIIPPSGVGAPPPPPPPMPASVVPNIPVAPKTESVVPPPPPPPAM